MFPMAALGALVVYAALRLIDIGELRRIGRFRRSELILAMTTTAAVLLFGVLYGVLVAIALRSWTCCAGSPGRTTASSATSQDWPACTTSTTTRTRSRSRADRVPLRRAAVLRQRRGLPARALEAVDENAEPRSNGSC